MGHDHQRFRAGEPGALGDLCRSVPKHLRAGRSRDAVGGVRGHADLDEADGDGSQRAALPHSRRARCLMTTGLQLALAAGALISLGVVLLATRLMPAEPDLAEALSRLTP